MKRDSEKIVLIRNITNHGGIKVCSLFDQFGDRIASYVKLNHAKKIELWDYVDGKNRCPYQTIDLLITNGVPIGKSTSILLGKMINGFFDDIEKLEELKQPDK